MQIATNVHRERIAYDYPYGETLTENEEALYWSATKDAEDALARIARIQKRRKGENGDIQSVLLSDEFRVLNDAIENLQEAMTVLHLIEKAADWEDSRGKSGSKALSELFVGSPDSIEVSGGEE